MVLGDWETPNRRERLARCGARDNQCGPTTSPLRPRRRAPGVTPVQRADRTVTLMISMSGSARDSILLPVRARRSAGRGANRPNGSLRAHNLAHERHTARSCPTIPQSHTQHRLCSCRCAGAAGVTEHYRHRARIITQRRAHPAQSVLLVSQLTPGPLTLRTGQCLVRNPRQTLPRTIPDITNEPESTIKTLDSHRSIGRRNNDLACSHAL